MSFRGTLVIALYLFNCFQFGIVQSSSSTTTVATPPPSQDERLFGNVCENCTVSKGFGFASHPYACYCYFTCVLRRSEKLAYYANPWVSYLRCCPCGTTFSKKLLTCVDYTDKRSDCFDKELKTNKCKGVPDGTLLPSQDPNSASLNYFKPLCSGFIHCTRVGRVVVPNPSCCAYGECFSGYERTCNSSFCTGSCTSYRKNDCDCDKTPEPTSECPYVGVRRSITKFMGVENMKTYDCAPGTCWDQDTCTCVRTNNTGYDDCLRKAELDFDNGDWTARDGRGNTIWTEVYGNVNFANNEASFVGDGYIGVGGLANTDLSNLFILHFEFRIPDIENGETECLVGSCLDNDNVNTGVDTIVVTLEAESEDESVDNLDVWLTYKDRTFWLPGTETTETVHLEITTDIEPGLEHEFWLFYGLEEKVNAGIFYEGALLGSDSAEIEGSVRLIPPKSGFVFGRCQKGDDFNGTLDEIEMWTTCKPYDESRLTAAHEAITNSTKKLIIIA